MRFAIDSNILVYAFVRGDPQKHETASEIMVRAMMLDSVLAAQSVAEFLNVIRRKEPLLFDEARAQALRWQTTFELVDTTAQNIIDGADFAARYKLQLWDSVIWQVVRTAHAVVFLTEDLQDGLAIDGMKVLNPFDAANAAELQNLLRSADEETEW